MIPGKLCGEFLELFLGQFVLHISSNTFYFINRFVDILRRQPGPQMSYQVTFSIWLLTFERNIAEEINK